MSKSKKQQREDIDFEIQFCEGVLKNSPNFIEGLMLLGDLYTKLGLYEQGLNVDLKLARLRPNEPFILYNLACSYSLVGQMNAAIKTIRKAIESGYDDFEHLEQDQDLWNLLSDDHFREYLKIVKKKKKVPGVKQAR